MSDNLVYGPVVFIKGEHKGMLGFYDDSEYSYCIVRVPAETLKYIKCRRSSIRNLIPLEQWEMKEKYPEFCKKVGVH